MAYNNGIDGKALLDEISKVIDAAANQYHEAGEDAGEEYVKGVVDGIKKHSKEAKSEIAKMYEEFSGATKSFKSRKSITNEDWSRVLGLSKELLKSERYADSVRDKLDGISATFKNIGKVSGIDKIVAELDKAENKLETVTWAEAGKNYQKRTTTARKPKKETPKVQADPAPVVKSEEKKQEAIEDTTAALREQEKAAESAVNAQKKLNDVHQAGNDKKSLENEFSSQLKALHGWKELAEKVQEQVVNSSSQHLRKNVLSALEGVSEDVASVIGESFVSALQNGFKGVRVKEIINMLHPIVNEAGEGTFMGAPITDMFKLLGSVDLSNFNMDSLLDQAKEMPYMFKPLFEILQKISDARKEDADITGQQTAALHEQEAAAESATSAHQKLNDAQQDSKTDVDINKAYDAVKYGSLYEDERKDILKNGKEISSTLAEQRKSLMQQLQPIREVTTRISEAASIKNIPYDSLRQEAANVGQRLSTMYDEGITETEEYISLQYKLVNILDRIADSAGGVKGSGAKSLAELHSWIFNSIKQDTGFDIGSSNAIEAIWGQGRYSIYGDNGKKRNMREIAADLVDYKGTSFTGSFGAYDDYNQLTKINAILKFIKENAQESREQVESQQDNIQQEIDLINKKTDAQKEFNKSKQEENILYHAGDLSNPSKTQKTYPLGHVRPSKSGGIFNGFTGLYTTEDIDGFWGNEWSGAPISTIDASQYKLFDARTDELATKAKEFFNSLNGTIYGYIEDFSTGEIKKITDVKSVDELWANFKEVFKNTDMTFEKFSDFVKKAQSLVSGKNFDFVDGLPDLDEGIVKTGEKSVLQGVSKEVFNSDSFQTQLLKMLGFEGIDLRGTKHNGTYTGGTVIFDVKPESIKTTNEKWSDVMASHGYEIDEADLVREEKRRQLAFDTAKAYSKIAEESHETKDSSIIEKATNNELKETFDIIQQGESVTGKFVTTANTVHEALENMRKALPEDKQAWGKYIDNILAQDDDKMIGAFKSISGSMGDRSELYKMENLGDGRVEVTFAGIREEIEATADTAEQSKKSLQDVLELIDKMSSESGDSDAFNKRHKSLIDRANKLTSGADYDQLYSQLIENENKYQHELEETNRINKEREGQLDAYAQAAGSFFGDSKYDGVSFDDKNKLFENFGNKIMQDGLSASDAMDQLYLSMEKLIQQSKEMPDDVIESFGAENEHVAETVSQLQKLSSIDLTRIFDNVDLKSFLQALNIDQSNFSAFRKLFEELMQITNAMANGVDVGNAFDSKMDEITNTIMRLGGHMVDLDDGGYATMMQDFYKHMSNTKVQFNDTIKADYTKDQWKSLYGTYKNRLTADLTKGIGADSLYHELSGLFPSLFPEGVLSQQDQFKLIFDKLDEARQLQANNWKTLQGFVSSDRYDIQTSVDNMYTQMSDALFADSSAAQLTAEADAFKEVEQSATKAANAKGKFSKKNKELGDSAAESSDDLDDEAESLENVNRAAAHLPDVSAYDSTTVRYDANGNPYNVSGTSRQEMIDGTHVRSTDNYQFDAENNRWDYMGTVQSAERTREMVQALEEYYRILNQIQKLRLDPSNAIHTEEVNKLETEDLARAYQRVCDLGIQVNDIEGQINLSVNQRRALLDVELRARQEMYDVIAKMEDKQATAATKPFQKTVADEIKKAANIDTNVRLLGDDGASERLQSQIADYRRLVDELVEMRLQLARNSDLANNADFSNRFADTAKRAQNARVAIEGVFKESQKLQKLGEPIAVSRDQVSDLHNLKSAMIEFASSALDGEVKINGFNKEGTEMYVTLNQGTGAVENITVALNRATGHLQAFSAGTSKATNEWEDFKTQAVQGAKNIIGMYVGFQEGVQAIRTGVNYVKEIDLAMTELKKVTDETDASYKQFLKDASGTASIIGSTISDFTEATATFARLGYSLEEASSMAETAVVYRNVADGLDSVEESSDSIISTMMAFGIEANDTMSIIDRFNAVGNSFAITSAGIGDALQRSASALFAAGNTIDESIALVTAANSVIQNPEQVGELLPSNIVICC